MSLNMGLREHIIRKLISTIPTFLVASVLIFLLLHIAPGDPVELMFRGSGHPVSPAIIETVRKQLGLDKPVYVQYFMWLGKFLRGDLGYSYITNRAISSEIRSRMWWTIELVGLAEIISLGLALLLGVVAATKKGTITDNFASITAIFGYSMPNFWIGILLILVFAIKLHWLPVFGGISPGEHITSFAGLIDHLRHLVLPLTVLSLSYTAYYFRLIRSSMLECLGQDFVTTARSKGLKESVVIYKHTLRNALVPVVTMFGTSIGFILAGTVVIETVFAWPGLGKYIVDSALARDYPAVMGINMIIILMVLLANLVTDIVNAIIDPRIRY